MTHSPVQDQQQPVYVKQPSNGIATAAMVLGIIGTVLAFIPILGAFGAFVGGVGIALAIAGFFVARSRGVGMGKTIAGFVLGVASLIVFFVVTGATVAAIDGAVDEVDKEIAAQEDTSASTDTSDAKEIEDAELGEAAKDDFAVTVDVTLTNNSPNASDYTATVVFESPDGSTQYGTGPLFVESLEPGQETVQEVMMLDELPDDITEVSARLTDFDRMESF